MNRVAAAAFPADAREEPSPVFDEVSGPHDVAEDIPGDKDDLDQDLLDALLLPGEPKLEGERRREWNKIPLRVRTAIRRLHRQFGHVPNKVLIQLMRLSRMDPVYIEAAKSLRCEACENHKRTPQTAKTAMPKKFMFNQEVGLDCFERYTLLNIVDQGTSFPESCPGA